MTAMEYALYGKEHGIHKLKRELFMPSGKPDGDWNGFVMPLMHITGGDKTWPSVLRYCDNHPEVWDELIYKLQQDML